MIRVIDTTPQAHVDAFRDKQEREWKEARSRRFAREYLARGGR